MTLTDSALHLTTLVLCAALSYSLWRLSDRVARLERAQALDNVTGVDLARDLERRK